jgi:hypothetical protein
MSDLKDLEARIEGAFTTLKEKVKEQQEELLQDVLERQKRLKQYEKVQARVVEVAKPRLEALAKRAGTRATVTPSVSQSRRQVTFEFQSAKASITLTFSVTPDYPVKNVVVEYNLHVIPVLWKFESHAEFSAPIDAFDADGLARWLDDKIVGFVELYIQIHEGELYDKAEYVEDPVANVKFPRFAAGATLESGGKTYFFIDHRTKAEFARQKGLATA